MGIGPTSPPWEGGILPVNYTRLHTKLYSLGESVIIQFMNRRCFEGGSNPIEAQIAHLEFLKSLIPGEEDITRYGLDEGELGDACRLFGYPSPDIIEPYLQLVYTILRKCRHDNPRKPLKVRDLSDLVATLMKDRGNITTNDLLFQMKEMGAIKVNRRKRVSIKI